MRRRRDRNETATESETANEKHVKFFDREVEKKDLQNFIWKLVWDSWGIEINQEEEMGKIAATGDVRQVFEQPLWWADESIEIESPDWC